MKRKLSLVVLVAMLAAVCFGVLAACNGLSDYNLSVLKTAVENQIATAEGKTTCELSTTVTMIDVDGKEQSCSVKWTADNGVIVTEGDGKVTITVPAGVTSYILTGTLVNEKGEAYKLDGEKCSVSKSVSAIVANQGNQGDNQGNQGDNQGNQGDNQGNQGDNQGNQGNQGDNQGNQGNQGDNQGNQGNQGDNTPKTVKEQFLDQVVKAPQTGTNYYLAMYYGLPNAVYYAKESVTSYKLDSTTTVGEAAVATLEATSGGYNVKLGGKYLNITSRKSGTKTYYNISLDTTATTVFTVDSNGVLLGAVDNDTYYIGTYQNGTETKLYTAMGANWSGYLTREGNEIDGNQFPVRLIPSNATITGDNQGNQGNQGDNQGDNQGNTGNQGGTTTTTPEGTTVSIDLTGKGVAGTGTAIDGAIALNADISATCAKGSGSVDPKYYAESLRLYGGNTMTITAAAGKTIKSIVFTYAQYDKENAITTDVGTFSTDTWTGSANSVTFSIATGSGHRRIANITVIYA